MEVHLFIITFNRPKLLEHALLSALSQDYPLLKIHVFDNSTNEHSRALVENLSQVREVEYVRTGNGLSAQEHGREIEARINAIVKDYYLVMHDDDMVACTHVSSSLGALKRHGGAVLCSRVQLIDSEGRNIGALWGPRRWFLGKSIGGRWGLLLSVFENRIPLPALFYRGDVKLSVGQFFESCGNYADYAFNLHLIESCGVYVSEDVTYFYRVHGAQDTASLQPAARKLRRRVRLTALRSSTIPRLVWVPIYLALFIADYLVAWFRLAMLRTPK